MRLATTKAFVIAIVGMLACGCASASKPALPAASAPAAPVGGPQTAARAAVLAAYSGMWSDYKRDLLTANWQNPSLSRHATGEAFMELENVLALDGHHGWIGKGAPVLSPEVRSVSTGNGPTSAEVVDCADLSHFLTYVAATGALKDSIPGGRHLIDAGLVLKGDEWKVSTLDVGQVGSC